MWGTIEELKIPEIMGDVVTGIGGEEPYDIDGGSNFDHHPLCPSEASVKGDLNGDGTLTPADAAIALRLAATGAHDDAADVSGDGTVTSLDALTILQAAAEIVEL